MADESESAAGGKLSREQLLEYVKKQKAKIKQLEEKVKRDELSPIVSLEATTATGSLEGLKNEIKSKDQKLLKYNALVKSKIKEIDALKAQLAGSHDVSSSPSSLSSTSSASA